MDASKARNGHAQGASWMRLMPTAHSPSHAKHAALCAHACIPPGDSPPLGAAAAPLIGFAAHLLVRIDP